MNGRKRVSERSVLDAFYGGHLAPSQIDRMFGLAEGTTRLIVVADWRLDKAGAVQRMANDDTGDYWSRI